MWGARGHWGYRHAPKGCWARLAWIGLWPLSIVQDIVICVINGACKHRGWGGWVVLGVHLGSGWPWWGFGHQRQRPPERKTEGSEKERRWEGGEDGMRGRLKCWTRVMSERWSCWLGVSTERVVNDLCFLNWIPHFYLIRISNSDDLFPLKPSKFRRAFHPVTYSLTIEL